MFRTLIYPSSGTCDYSVELPHWSYCSWFDVCWSFGLVGLEWYPCCRIQPATRIPLQTNHKLLMMDILKSEACWAHKQWNKLSSDVKLVFYSSTSTMMHGPINIRSTCIVSVASITLVCSEAICRYTDCYSRWYLITTGWKCSIIILLILTSQSWKYVHVANSSYGTNLNFQIKGLAYIVAFCAQFLELSCSSTPQSLGGKCSISFIITYHNTPVPRVNVFGRR